VTDASEIAIELTKEQTILAEVALERAKQRAEWSLGNDALHTDAEWRDIIIVQITKDRDFRENLVKTAAVALTALSVIDASSEAYQSQWER